jgi:hypothetical protein
MITDKKSTRGYATNQISQIIARTVHLEWVHIVSEVSGFATDLRTQFQTHYFPACTGSTSNSITTFTYLFEKNFTSKV